MGLSASAVFSTFPKPRFDLALTALVAPVPPLAIATFPIKVPASAATVISALPSNETPLIFREVANFIAVVAVAELPVVF